MDTPALSSAAPMQFSGRESLRAEPKRGFSPTIEPLYLVLILLCAVVVENAQALTATPPERTPSNLIVASYNIKWLGNRDHHYERLAEVIQHFDICGIIEIKKEKTLKKITDALELMTGEEWGYVFGQRTHRPKGTYYEAYGYIWRKNRVELGGGIVSNLWDREEIFRNDPFLASFRAGSLDFTMILMHTRWSNDAEGTRAGEVKQIAEEIINLESFLPENEIFLAGDFNYSNNYTTMKEMAATADMELLTIGDKTTLSDSKTDYVSSYDHIYGTKQAAELVNTPGEALDVTTLIYGSRSLANIRKSKRELSDHLPVFIVINQ